MALVSALLGGASGFAGFLVAFFLLNVPLATAGAVYVCVALIAMIGLNVIALAAAPTHAYQSTADQYS